MFKRSEMIDEIQTYLGLLQSKVNFANDIGKTDLNTDSEDFFCKLLNFVYKLNLKNLNKLQVDFPAIDLGDNGARTCFQLTSRVDINKIRETLDAFERKELYHEYDTINILVIGNKSKHTAKLDYKHCKFKYDENLFDITNLSKEIAKKDKDELKLILDLFKREYSDKIIEIIKETREDKSLYFPKKVSEDNYFAYYAYGLGQVRIDAFLPKNLDQELSCCILFQQPGLSDCMISFDEDEIKEILFEGHEKGLTGERGFIWYLDMDNDKVGIKFPNNRFVTNINTARQLCDIINDLFYSYLNSKQKIYEVIGANHFNEKSIGEFLILQVPRLIWIAMVDFAQRHDHYSGDTVWDIFKPLNLIKKNRIIIYKNHLHKIKADVLAELHVEDMSNSFVEIIWKTGYSPSVGKMDGFDNQTKWKVDYTHDWILEEFIPYIIYLNYMDNRSLFERISKRGFSFIKFKNTFDYKKFGIESAYVK